MASFVPQISDSGFSTSSPTYDWGFLQANQQKKEGQYQQGLSELAQGYSAIANQQVTDDGNRVKKAEWLKAAQDGLKKISASDLSLPKNVAQAESLYAPFYSDNMYMQDVGYTRYSQGELSRLDSWKYSKDEDTRKQYNQYAERYIQQGIEDFSTYNRDPEKYRKIQKRSAVPFYDVDADVDKAYKDEQQKGVSTVTTSGPQMTTEVNGIKSKDAFRTYYLSRVGNKYDEQFRVIGSVKAHDAKSAILRQNPYMDEKSLNQEFAGNILDGLGQQIVRNRDSYSDQLTDWQMKYDTLKKQVLSQPGHIMHPDQETSLQQYSTMIAAYGQEVNNYDNQYKRIGAGNPNSENYQRQFQDISLYPEQYIASLEKQGQADIWASGMASMSATKVEANPAWVALQTELDKAADRRLRAAEIQTTQRGQTLKWMEDTGRDLKGNLLPGANPGLEHLWYGLPGDGSGTTNGVPNPSSGQYLGRATVDVAHLPTGLDILEQVQDKNRQQINNSVYDISGIAGALKTAGLTPNEIIDFTEGSKVMMSGQHPNTQQAAVWDKVKGIMKGNGIDYPINGPQAMTTALITYAGQAGTKLYNSGTDEGRAAGGQLLNAYMSTAAARDKFLANEQEFERAKKDIVFSQPNVYGKITTDDGRIADKGDIEARIPAVTVQDPTTGRVIHLDKRTLTQAYIDKVLDYKGGQDLQIAGKRYTIVASGDKKPSDYGMWSNPFSEFQEQLYSLYSRHGTPEQFFTLRQHAASEVLPNLKEVKDGLIGREIGWDPTVKSQNAFATGLSKELANPANTGIVYTKNNSNEHIPVKGSVDAAVRSILSSADDIKTYTTGPVLSIDDNTGEKAYYVQFRPDVSNDKTTTSGVSVKDLAGQRFYIPVSPNAEGVFLESVPPITSMFTYGDLLYGKTLTSDPVIESSGMKYSIKPYDKGQDGRYTRAYVNINRVVPDPVHPGKSLAHDEVNVSVPMLSGSNSKSPDEIVNAVHGQVVSHAQEVTSNSKNAHRNVPAGGKTFEQFEKELNH